MHCIVAYKNGEKIGYVCDLTGNSFVLCTGVEKADKFETLDEVQGNIDICTSILSMFLYVYEEVI